MGGLLRRLAREIREILPAFVFFTIMFSIVIATDALYVRNSHVNEVHFAAALILGFIVSKGMLLANMLPFIDAFPRRPLVYNIAWKTGIYTIVDVSIYFLERFIEAAVHHRELSTAVAGVQWSRFWMVIIWLLVSFLVFVSYLELDRRLGHGKLRQLLFCPLSDQDR